MEQFDFQKFYMGECYNAYEYLGAHLTEDGAVFRTFAPKADRVIVMGDFNDWQEQEMTEAVRAEFFECHVPGAAAGQMYKYVIYGENGRVAHCDPYSFGMELRPGFASVLRDLDEYAFGDDRWMKNRSLNTDRPLNIYEMHLGSWRRKETEEGEDVSAGWYRYDEIAEPLVAFLLENRYTHVAAFNFSRWEQTCWLDCRESKWVEILDLVLHTDWERSADGPKRYRSGSG